jgi:hypothetical protein
MKKPTAVPERRSLEKDIVEKFGPYDLVVRDRGGKHQGVLWKGGEQLVSVTAASNAEARALLESRYYVMREEQVAARGAVDLVDQTIADAFVFVWPHLTSGQKAMLQTQYRAPLLRMTSAELATAAGYKSHSAVNLWYGRAGQMLFHEAPRRLPTGKDGRPVFSFTLSIEGETPQDCDKKSWVWEMRPQVARGLEIAAFVS